MTETSYVLSCGARVIKPGETPAERLQMVDNTLRGEAARLLAVEMDSQPLSASAGTNGDLVDDGADERPLGVDRELIPVGAGVDDESRGLRS